MKYLIVGGGALARHFASYFKQLEIPFSQWQRSQNPENDLISKINMADTILLAISDNSIEDFYHKYCSGNQKFTVHFSGAYSIPGIYSAHPLMSFGPGTYSLKEYQSIPFITEKSTPRFNEIFSELSNPSFAIDSSLKPLYHSLCALMVNVPQILWGEGSKVLQKDVHLPKEIFLPIIKKSLENFIIHSGTSATGAIARKDVQMIHTHIENLKRYSLDQVYTATAGLHNDLSEV